MDQRREPGRCDLSRNLGDPDWAAKLVGRFSAHEDPTDVSKRTVDHKPRFLRPHGDGAQRSRLFRLGVTRRHRPADAKHPKAMDIAKIVFELLELGCGLEIDWRAATSTVN